MCCAGRGLVVGALTSVSGAVGGFGRGTEFFFEGGVGGSGEVGVKAEFEDVDCFGGGGDAEEGGGGVEGHAVDS